MPWFREMVMVVTVCSGWLPLLKRARGFKRATTVLPENQ